MKAQRVDVSTALVSAVAGQVLLVGTVWLLPFASAHRVTDDTIGELVLGPYGFLLTLAFAVAALGLVTLAIAIRKAIPLTAGARAGSGLLATAGVALLIGGLFDTDRLDGAIDWDSLSANGVVHLLAVAVSFICAVAAMVVLTWTFARSARWRPFTPWSGLLATGSVSLLLAQGGQQDSSTGLLQRLLVTLVAAWVVAVAWRVRSSATDAHEARSTVARP
ncbi:DUF998 domain-containing protein [Asanoa sp. WMMD1127]|uniref:DUF998 domain-containing protein n=1 Tax=Asanoa sp. WMMD1127 TaxID=3016107 RepID=UPI0024172A20|nr:DUF998 domain-containing protein [Asanoa sp. WMMD1127]MDG4824958.1 DUF998 domain-containing protein [Asanoa sp. WMMD1127]